MLCSTPASPQTDPQSGQDLRRRAWILVVTPSESTPLSYADAIVTESQEVTALEPPGGPNPVLCLSSDGTPGTALCKRLAFPHAFVNAWAERSCSQMCSNTAASADVRESSPVSKSLVALKIRSLANCGEHAAGDWRSRGRRFKSCHPDGKQQVRGRFGQNPRRPLCCRVAIGVATAHVLTSPLLLRAAGRRSARPRCRRGLRVAGDRDEACPSSSETVEVARRPRACAWQMSASTCAGRHR
jgi:hypothetical protein